MNLVSSTIKSIKEPDKEAMELTREKWDGLVKPVGSLGELEEISIKIAGIRSGLNNKVNKKCVVVMCADNGIVEEGVSAAPQHFTALLAESMANGGTGLSALAKFFNVDVKVVDIGLAEELEDENIINRSIAKGSKNFAKEAAMTYEDALKALEIGIEIGDKLYHEGYDILGTGELGMGNTTTSSAVLGLLSDYDADSISGRGAGLTDEQFDNKKAIIGAAIDKYKKTDMDPIEAIAMVGGFDIGGLCGLYLSAAKNRLPIVVDGFISSVAALCAVRLNPLVKKYLIPSHLSFEKGAGYVMEELGLKPILTLNMRLGEGSGCPLAMNIIEAALYTLDNMATFEEASIDSKVLINLRDM